MEIRDKITAEDFYDIRESVAWKEINVSQLKKSLKNTMITIGIYEDDLLVAMGRLVGDFSLKGMLTDIIVRPSYQHKGYGKIVVTEILKSSLDFITTNETLCIEASPTHNNRDFYVKCGLKYKPENQDGVYIWLKNDKKDWKIVFFRIFDIIWQIMLFLFNRKVLLKVSK